MIFPPSPFLYGNIDSLSFPIGRTFFRAGQDYPASPLGGEASFFQSEKASPSRALTFPLPADRTLP